MASADVPAVTQPHPTSLQARRRWPLFAAVGLGVVAIASLLAFGLANDPAVVESALLGKPAPAFDLPTLDGNGRVDLSDLRGQVVVVNFWASWCAECKVEHPHLAEAWERYRDQGVVVVGITVNDSPSASRAYAREMGGDWPLLVDDGSRTALEYGVYGVPETFVIAPDGRVAHRTVGPVTYEDITEGIASARRMAGSGS